jgi:hypothetical protein
VRQKKTLQRKTAFDGETLKTGMVEWKTRVYKNFLFMLDQETLGVEPISLSRALWVTAWWGKFHSVNSTSSLSIASYFMLARATFARRNASALR